MRTVPLSLALLLLAACGSSSNGNTGTVRSTGGAFGFGGNPFASATGAGGNTSTTTTGTGGNTSTTTTGAGGNTSTTTTFGPAPTVSSIVVEAELDAAIRAFAVADCGKIMECLPSLLHRLYGSEERCIERSLLVNRWNATLPSYSRTAPMLVELAATWTEINCSDYARGNYPETPAGTGTNGEPCNSSVQCASKFCSQEGYACGVCSESPGEGAACDHNRCGSGLSCLDSTCQRLKTENEECSEAAPCRSDLACYSGVCTTKPAEASAACDANNGLGCDGNAGFVCYITGKVCVPTTVYRDPGGACGIDASLDHSIACNRGYCSTDYKCTSYYVADGATCDTNAGLYCEWPTTCQEGVCMRPEDFELCGG